MSKTFSEGTSSVQIVKYISPSKLQGGVRFKRAAMALKSPWSVGDDWRTKLRHTLPADKFDPKRSLPRVFTNRYATYKKKKNPKNIDFEFCKIGPKFFRQMEGLKTWIEDSVSYLNSFYYTSTLMCTT